ncbi:MAG: hypothetical protein ABMA14_17390 [Hyphomonadaceae bacterium]
MNKLMFGAALGAMVWAFAPLGALAQTTPAPTPISISDDLNADGVKLRGDGSIDDDQPNAGGAASDDDIGDDGLKHHGDGSVDDDQTGGEDHVRGRDRERDDRDDDHRGSDHDRGRDRDRDNDRSGNRGHG